MLLGLAIWPAIASLGPSLEGRYWPVTDIDRTGFTKYVRENQVKTLVRGVSWRIRKCDFHAIEWFHATSLGQSRVDVELLEKSKVRPTGYMEWGPWFIHMVPDDLVQSSKVWVYHTCHPLWKTKTLFYDSSRFTEADLFGQKHDLEIER